MQMYYDPCFQSERSRAKKLAAYTNLTILTFFQPCTLSPKHHCPETCQSTQTCKMIDRQERRLQVFWGIMLGLGLAQIFFFLSKKQVFSQDYLIYFSDICQVAGSFYASYTAALNTGSQGHETQQSNQTVKPALLFDRLSRYCSPNNTIKSSYCTLKGNDRTF